MQKPFKLSFEVSSDLAFILIKLNTSWDIYIKQLNSCGVVLIVLNVDWMSMKLWVCLCYIPVFLPLGMLKSTAYFICSLHTKVLLVCSTTEIAAAKWCRFSTWIFLCCRNLRRSVFTVLYMPSFSCLSFSLWRILTEQKLLINLSWKQKVYLI